MKPPDDYDVIVIGARVAGASTAMLLARAGLRVGVFERSKPGTDMLSTHAFMRAGVLQLSRWGVLPGLVAAGTPPIHSTSFRYGDGRCAQVSIRPSPGVDALYAPRRHLLDSLLVTAAVHAGATMHHATSVRGLLRDDDGRVRGVRIAGPEGELAVRAPLTIGADGIGSLVAREVGADVVLQGRAASAVLYRYLPGHPADEYVWAYGDAAASGLIPTNHGEACVFVATTPARMRSLRRSGADAAFDTLLAATAMPGFQEMRGAGRGRVRGWRGLPGFVRRPFGPGWALVGDAGYFKDPITTHGMTDALRDAELLADAVVRHVGGAPAAIALAQYQHTRDRLSRGLVAVTEAVCRYDWDPEQVRVLLRRVSSTMSDEVDHLTARALADDPASLDPV
jgi:flavin-dependent dehydrogenase